LRALERLDGRLFVDGEHDGVVGRGHIEPDNLGRLGREFGIVADSDEAGHAFRFEAGRRFRFEAGRGSDLMSATWRLLPRIDAMMFCSEPLVKRAWIWMSAEGLVAVGNGGRSALSIAP
jgi:hypothetical protein